MDGDAYARGSRGSSSRDHHSSSRDDRRGDAGGRDRERDRDSHRDRDDTRHRDDGRDRTRRRSRSPAAASSRRGYENDSYSSSRGYREREREDRFTDRRDRDRDRGDRDRGDRDRGAYGRRDTRRDDGPPRRDRDAFDDRRGGRGRDGFGGGRREPRGDPFAANARGPSPPRKAKEPTPDLTDVQSILTRKRRLTQWDIKPQGYEKVTAEQAKLSGMFPLPGAPRQTPMDPTKLQAFMDQPAGDVSSTVLAPTNSRQSKRLFVDQIPSSATNDSLAEFFNLHMNGLNVIKGKDPCVSAQLSPDRSYALLEFKTAEDATYALTLSGVSMEDVQMSNGENGSSSGLKLRRPKDYIAPAQIDDKARLDHGPAPLVPDSPNKIAITGIPTFIDSDGIESMFVAIGPLKSFVMVQESGSETSRGTAFCEFADNAAALSDQAIELLNGTELAEFKIRVYRACQGERQLPTDNDVNGMSVLVSQQREEGDLTRVLCFLNMVTGDDLVDDDEYEEICQDVREECAKFGTVDDMKVPRPPGMGRTAPGVGKIYVKYDQVDSATKALNALAGRNFAGRTVVATYFNEELFDIGAW